LGTLLRIAILLIITFNLAQSQTNLTLKLGEESILLDQLVTCGEADQQVVFFTSAGTDLNPRTNIQATLNLFPGVNFDALDTDVSTSGVTLVDGSNHNQPIFSLPDFDPLFPADIAIAFSVKIDCGIIDTLNTATDLQIFDRWQLDYTMAGSTFSENFNGVEYKDAIAIPNLNVSSSPDTDIYRIGAEVSRNLTISNSGLNSYLDNFDLSIIQEQGVSYKSLSINGVDYAFSKEANASGDTLITANISGAVFNGNTQEFGLQGNGDRLFDVDEIVTIEEVLEIVNCGADGNSNLSATHEVTWGCNSTSCREESQASNISIGVGEELIEFTYNRAATVDAGYCDDGTLSITVANNGFEFDDGFGTILDISTGVGFAVGSDFLTSDQGYEVLTISIAGSNPITTPNGLIDLNNNPVFSTDPDGPGGLSDFDGDGFFDDLRVGESFEMTATFGTSCSEGAVFDVENECDNDFRGNFDGKITYANSCGINNETLFDNFYRTSNSGSTQETCTDPDAFNDNDQFTVIYSGERRMSNFNRTCVGNDEVSVTISLPDGISLSTQTSIQQDTTKYTGVSQILGSEVVVTFDAAPINLNNDYQLNFVFETNCSSVGPTSFPVEITYFCPDCNCSNIWYCGILEGATLHAAGAPCAEFVCETGLQTTNFEVERTTFGYTDENFTTRFDPTLANKKVALSCDSVVMKMTNIVGNQSLSDSIGLSINYGNADENDSEKTSFLFAHADITIQSGGNTRTGQIDTTAYEVELIGNNKIMHFDLSSCLDGLTLNRGDEINFIGHFAVNPDGPIPANTFKKIPEFRARGYAVIDGVRYDECDSFGELFRLAKLNTTFSGPSNSAYPEGCAETNLAYTLSKSINANAMREFFGEEHRAAVKVDSIKFTYDPNILTAFEQLSVEYRIQGSQWFPLAPLDATDNGVYQQGFSLLNTLSTIAGSNQVFQFRINIIPECSALFGSALGNDLYDIEAKIDYNNRFYANDENPDCIESTNAIDKRQFQYQNPPTFTLEAVVEEVEATAETVQWTIEHCNTSFAAAAGITFIQMETMSGNLEILSIENISIPLAIDTLSLQTYGTENDVFAFANGLSNRGTNVAPADICNTFRITARLVECGESSTAARLGWSCVPFEEPNWNPNDYAPCESESVLLKASAVSPLLSASFQEQSSTISGVLCDTSTMIILVRNEEAGRAYDIQSQIILPTGATLVPNSVEFAYPSTASFQSATAEPSLQEVNELGQVYQYDNFANLDTYLDQDGLPGFSITAPDSSEFRLKYRFVTNCDYENGELNRYSFKGITSCGTASNNAFAETNPIIFQADPGAARAFDIQFTTTTPLKSGQPATFEISVENISPNISVEDKIEIVLPAILSYTPNSIQAISPSSWNATEPVINIDGEQRMLNVSLPAGLIQGNRAIFQLDVVVAEVDCDSLYAAKVSTTSSIEFTCVINNESCVYDFSSSSEAVFEIEKDCSDGPCVLNLGTVNEAVLMPDCDSTMYYCFNQYTPEAIENYTISDNGVRVDSSLFSICDYRQVCIYTYAQINSVGGTIMVDSWTVNGQTYSGLVGSISELVDSMNAWDEGGNWVLLPEVLIIQGGHISGTYSRMEVSFPDKGIRSSLGYDTRLTPIGVSIFLTEGFHQLVITDENGCVDTLNIDLVRQNCPSCIPAKVENIIVENANCEEDNGTAIVNINNDPANYIFNWSPNVGTEGPTPNSRTNLPSASYLVQIIDKSTNTCFETVFVNIGNAEGPQSTAAVTNTICGETNGQVELSPTEYTYSWQDGAIGASRVGLAEGRYIITVTDPELPSCPSLVTVDIEAISPLTVSHTVFQKANCLNNNGIIAIDVVGGSGQYSTSFPDGNLAQTGLAGGSYQITVTDDLSGCTAPYLFLLNNEIHNGAITILDTIDVTCVGNTDGQIDFEIVYENGFRFPSDTIITDGQRIYQNGNLPAGDYQLLLKDGNDCNVGSSPFTIRESSPLVVNVSKSGGCDAVQTIGITVDGAETPYIFDWADINGVQNEKDRNNLSGGNYLLTITNAAGCELPLTIELDSCDCVPATSLMPTVIAADCGITNGEIAIEIDQNIGDYTFIYEPNLGTEGTTKNSRIGLPKGAYEVIVAYQGDTTCISSIVVTIPENEVNPDLIGVTDITPADCGVSNGAVSISLNADPTAYTFIYTPNLGEIGTTNNVRRALPAGDYEVLVAFQGDTTCATMTTVNIPENEVNPDLIGVADITPADCGVSNGAISISLNADPTAYTFIYTPNLGEIGTTNNVRRALPAGDYEVLVAFQGDTSCATMTTVNVPENGVNPDLISATDITAADCGESNGVVSISLTEDPTNYTFIYTPNLGVVGTTNNIRTALPAGDYEVLVALGGDTNCAVRTMVSVLENELSDAIIVSTDITPANCSQTNGAITLSMDGVIADFIFEWDENSGAAGSTPNTREGLSSGDYEVTLSTTNNPNCSFVYPFSIPTDATGELPLVDTLITPADCGHANGEVLFNFVDNTTLYDYTWTPNLGVAGSALNSRVDLPEGTYEVNIVDRANPACSYDIDIIIDQIPVSVEATVFPSNCAVPPTGTAVISPAQYEYIWPDGFVGESRNELAPGIYEVTFSDPNGDASCRGVQEIVIDLTDALTATALINQHPTCQEANGAVTLSVTGGSDNYTYSWDSETNLNNTLAAGSYSVTVFDATLGCQTQVGFDLDAIPQGVANITIADTIPVSCEGNSDGGIQFLIDISDDFQLPMDTIITDGTASFDNGQLPAGSYCLEIRDANDCLTGEACFTIGASPTLMLMYETVAACADTGAINLEILGGVGPFQVDWADLTDTDNPTNRMALDTGVYEVTVIDSRGCSEMASIMVPACEACALPTITEISTTPTSCNEDRGSIFIELEEDERDYDFFYMPEEGEPFVTGNIRASLPEGKYRVLIVYKPNPACVLEIPIEIFEKDFSDLVPISSPADCGIANGQALLIPATNRYTWADGFVGNERTGLASGAYLIRVRDETFDCETMITLVVDELNLLEAKIAINTPPTCGNADGSVTVNVNGGSGDYSYDWVGGTASRNNLSSGTYAVLVTDNRTGCRTPVVFTLIDAPSAVVPITIDETINASCPLAVDGEVFFTVDTTDAPGPLDTVISNGHTYFLNGRLPQGDYCISVIDTLGCAYGQACFTIGAPEVLILTTDIIQECEDGGSISIEIDGGVAPYSFDWADVTGFGDQANRTDLSAGTYSLTVTDVNGCQAIAEEIVVTLCEPCPLQLGRDTVAYNLTDCEGTAAICLDYDFDARNPYNVSLDGANIDLFAINSCSTDTISTYSVSTLFGQGRVGPYRVTSWPVNGEVFSGDFTTLESLITAMNGWDPEGEWQFSQDSTFIVGGASGSSYGQIDATVAGTPIMSFLSLETRIWQRGVSIDLLRGVHEVIIQDPRTFCADTITVAVTCVETDTMQIVNNLGQMDTICRSTMELAGTLDTIILDCYEATNLNATIFGDTCVIIEGMSVGEDTLCVILCDDLGICDTTIIEVDVQYDEIQDTILVQNTNTFCIDTLGIALDGTIISMMEVCQDSTTGFVDMEVDLESLCVNYTGKTIGKEELCVEVCDDLGLCDTIEFSLVIQNDPPDLVLDTIFVGETITYCFDSIIFPNIITYLENECPEDGGENVDFILDEITYCIEYTGKGIGREQACVVLCDEDNICDTAFFDIEVIEFLELPTAVDDIDTTRKGVPIVLNVKENDIPFGVEEDGLEIITEPLFGDAILNLDGSITYFGDEFCEREDQFTYRLCNSNGCDTATVSIYILCFDVIVFTAMSPNRDGINDVLFISDIDKFPNSELKIFNRWGNIVYQTTNYQNDWNGTWKNNQELPDGTYFYRLRLNEPDDDRMFEGFIELHR